MSYLWKESVNKPHFTELGGDVQTDVLIIGGGIAGILCAYMLQQQGKNYILVEAEGIGGGTTKGTTAAITAQHGNIYTKLLKRFGRDTAKAYLDVNLKAVEKFREMSHEFSFDFEERDSYTYSLTDENQHKVEAAVVRELGFDAEYTKDPGLPFETAGGVRFAQMAQMHPLKFIYEISKGLNIRENTFVKQVKNHVAYTDKGNISAKKIIIASHYPIINSRGLYPLKLYQKRSFVLALESAPVLHATYADTSSRGIYLRNYGDLLIAGGGDHRTGVCNDGFEIVRSFVRKHFKGAAEKYAWAEQDCISLDGIPYIGRYASGISDIFVISGFNEWGMTSSMAAASVITDMITGKYNPYIKLFAPDRCMMNRQLAVNIRETVKNLVVPADRRCSHLGCGLKKNYDENTWDCPCHGSRFDDEGNVISNPALKNLK